MPILPVNLVLSQTLPGGALPPLQRAIYTETKHVQWQDSVNYAMCVGCGDDCQEPLQPAF